jgi:hypothetical protein
MIRCRGCGSFAREDNFCQVCGKSPNPTVSGINPYTWGRWDDTQRYLWRVVVEMGVRDTDEYLGAVWEA